MLCVISLSSTSSATRCRRPPALAQGRCRSSPAADRPRRDREPDGHATSRRLTTRAELRGGGDREPRTRSLSSCDRTFRRPRHAIRTRDAGTRELATRSSAASSCTRRSRATSATTHRNRGLLTRAAASQRATGCPPPGPSRPRKMGDAVSPAPPRRFAAMINPRRYEMALSNELATIAARAKEAETRAAAVAEKGRADLIQEVALARASALAQAERLRGAAEATESKVAVWWTDVQQSWNEHAAKARESIDTKRGEHDVQKAKRRAARRGGLRRVRHRRRELGRGRGGVRGALCGPPADGRRAGGGGAPAEELERDDVVSAPALDGAAATSLADRAPGFWTGPGRSCVWDAGTAPSCSSRTVIHAFCVMTAHTLVSDRSASTR